MFILVWLITVKKKNVAIQSKGIVEAKLMW